MTIEANRIISRGVGFYEEVFPFQAIAFSEQMIDPFSQVVLPILIPDIPPSPSVNPTVEIHFSSQPSHANENPYQQISRIIKPPPYLKCFHYNLLYY